MSVCTFYHRGCILADNITVDINTIRRPCALDVLFYFYFFWPKRIYYEYIFIYYTNGLTDVNHRLELYDCGNEQTIDAYCSVYCLQLGNRRTVSQAPSLKRQMVFGEKFK